LSDHKHILPYLATIQVGENLFILSELADTNLEQFIRSDSPWVQTFTNLIQQMTSIAGALRFLHEGIQLPGRLITCYHMDLKPDNILVFGQKNDHFGVGTWKISDFGISTFKEYRNSTETSEADITVRDLLHRVKKSSGVPAKRPGGPFQAPEVHVSGERHAGTKSDVWSFGCIFVEVLAFACGGRDLVEVLEDKRGKALDGKSSFPNDYFYAMKNSTLMFKCG
jgi:serine/threonine protein kinase